MKTLKTISFISYVLVGLLGFAFAFIYLFRSEFMPYHAVAVGSDWNDIDHGMQILILALMRVSGGGWLATAISITIPVFLAAQSLFIVVPGERKADAVYHTLHGGINTDCPATILRSHADAILFLDMDSAGFL